MAVRRGSTGFVAGVFVVAVLAADGGAQQADPRPPAPGLPAPPPPKLVPAPEQLGRIAPSVSRQPASATAEFPEPSKFQIDPKTPVKDLLPAAPKSATVTGPLLADDLAKVPEVAFEAWPEKPADGKVAERMAHQLAKISHANAKKTDAFVAALVENREDLAGLPFVMGDDCRTSADRTKQFTLAVNTVRSSLTGSKKKDAEPPGTEPAAKAKVFWDRFTVLCEKQDAARARDQQALAEHATVARVGALTQVLAVEPAELRLGLVKYLTGVAHPEATRALARLAIFSAEEEVRHAATDSLSVRNEKDYTDILLKGLRYPHPAVARRAAEAIARMARTDLVPELVAVLDEADPRMPATKEAGGKAVAVVREVVRVNHHRNCMMCHAPGSAESVAAGALTIDAPVPGQPFPPSRGSYRQSSLSSGLAIRVDVTYLRQDFSLMMPVADAHPWPETQRFDFLVRERAVSADEAGLYREKLTPKEEGVFSPYHKAALSALREVTGKDAAPTAEAWRKLLKLPAKAAAATTPAGGKPRE